MSTTWSPEAASLAVVVQICSPASFSTDPHLVELARVDRVRLV
jgi:hypothetical protein